MKIYNNEIQIECDNIISKKNGKMTYYYAHNYKINDKMKVDFICSCGKKVTTNIKAYKKDNRLLCKECKTKQTNLKKYGFENPLQNKEIFSKVQNTLLKKYGTTCIAKTDRVKEIISQKNKLNAKNAILKRKQTLLEKYGVEHSFQIKETIEKIKESNLVKYNGHPMNNVIIKEKIIKQHYYKYYKRLLKRCDIQPLFTIENYHGISDEIEYDWLCKKCNNAYKSKIYTGYIKKCPICYPNQSGMSNLEKEIVNFIKSLGINNVIENSKSIIPPQELDIYLPDYKLAIEYNGLYWHSELQGKDKNYHLNKTIECEKQGIRLLHIFEDEWIDKSNIIKNIIKTKLDIIENKIGARKCILKEVDNQRQFLEENHIQGYIPAKINIGLYYQNELVSLLTFGRSRFNKQYNWEILRYVSKQGYSIIGGFNKMLKYFINNYPGSIITYSDRRLFNGNIYKNNGFIHIGCSNPNYYYTDGRQHRYNRQQFQKHKLKNKLKIFDSNLTEWENMQMNEWDRIWDCGNFIFTNQQL